MKVLSRKVAFSSASIDFSASFALCQQGGVWEFSAEQDGISFSGSGFITRELCSGRKNSTTACTFLHYRCSKLRALLRPTRMEQGSERAIPEGYVKLISEDECEFLIDMEVAKYSTALRSMFCGKEFKMYSLQLKMGFAITV